MFVHVERDDDGVLLTVSGELDLSMAGRLVDDVLQALDAPRLHLDLFELSFIDSSGIAALLKIREECRRHEVPLRIVRASRRVIEVLEMTGVAPLFDMGEIE